LAFGVGALLLAGGGAATGWAVANGRTGPALAMALMMPATLVSEAASDVAAAIAPAAPAQRLSGQCPKTTPVEPPWMDSGPIAPPTAPETPSSLEQRVTFWTRVWGELPDNYHLIVDERRPWVIHAEVDCRDLFGGIVAPVPGAPPDEKTVTAKSSCGGRITQARREAQAKWKRTWSQPAHLKLYAGNKSLAKNAHEHLLTIQGRKDALARAKDRAGPHLGHSEGLFALEEVPRIYARAAIVESLWRPEALSRSGAAGAYQFMPKTGAQYLHVAEGVVDERLDPLRSSWAAARYMHDMSKQLDKSWPLTLTAYNTGPARLKRVMKHRKTRDLGRIADAGDWGEFGFDGQNYYAQIVAIGRLTVNDAFEPQPVTGRALRLEEGASFADVAACNDIPQDVLARANPALHDDVVEGRAHVPAGYVTYLPDNAARTAFNFDGAVPFATPTSSTR
jgi:hypothetical protein